MHLKRLQHTYNSRNFKIAFSGVMLGLVLLFSFLQRFFIFGSFLKFDFSLIFIVATLFVAKWPYAITLILARFFIAPIYNEGYTPLGFLGQSVLLIVAFSYIATTQISFDLLKIKNKNMKMIVSLVLATIVTIVVVNIANMFLINLLYFTIFNNNQFTSLGYITENWEGYKPLFFFMPNYYLGSILLYTSFNLILLTITSLISFVVYKTIQKL